MADFFGDMYPGLFEEKKNAPGFVSDIKRGTGQLVSSVGSTLQDIGAEDLGSDIESYGEKVVRRNPSQINTLEDALYNPLTTAREAVGEVVPQVGASVAMGLGGRVIGGALGTLVAPGVGTAVGQTIGAGAGAYLGNLVQSYGGIRSEQRASGQEDIGRAIAAGSASAALDTAFGAERVANKVLGKGTSFLARAEGERLLPHVGKQFARGFAEEAGTEVAQTGLERVGAFKGITGEGALDEYGLAAIKGGFGGGAIRSGLSSVAGERKDGSILSDANNSGTAGGTETSAINSAIDQNSPEFIGPRTEQFGPPELVGPRQPYSGTPIQVTPSGDALVTPAQQEAYINFGRTQLEQKQEAEAQQQAQQDAVNAQRQKVLDKYGFETIVPGDTEGHWKFLGKDFFNRAEYLKAIDNVVKQEAGKNEITLDLEDALQQGGNKLAPGALRTMAATLVGQTPEKTLYNINAKIAGLAAKGKDITNPELSRLASAYETLTGQEAPAYSTVSKGKQDERLQLQSDAGVRAVSEPSGEGKTTTGEFRLLRPSGVQPVSTGSIAQGQTSQQAGQLPGEGIRTTEAGAVRDVAGDNQIQAQGQVNGQGQAQVASQEGRSDVSGQAVEGSRTVAEETQDRAEGIVGQVVNSIVEAVVKRTGRMSAKNLASLKEFIYYDFFQVAAKGKDGLSVKDLSEMYKVSTDTIDGWRDIAGRFFDENRGVIQSKILESIAANGTTLEQLKLDLQAVRNSRQNDVVVLEEAEALITGKGEKLSKDEAEIEETARGELEGFKLDADESTLDQRDLGSETGGMSVSTGRVQSSIQEQDKPEETINARIGRKLKEYNKAVEAGDEAKEVALMAEIDDLTKEAKKVDTKRVAKATAIAEDKAPKKRKKVKDAVQKPSAEKVPVREGTGSSEGVRKEDTEKREVTTESKAKTEEVKDNSGNPLVVYHGTNAEFEEFDAGRSKDKGVWFTPNRSATRMFGDKVVAATVTMNNPYEAKVGESKQDAIDNMSFNGHDGVIVRDSKGEIQVLMVPEASQITRVSPAQAEESAWNKLPVPIQYEQLSPQAKADWAIAVKKGKTNLAAANEVYEDNMESIQAQIADESKTIDGKDLITEVGEKKQRLLITDQTSKLSEAQNERLEKHYGAKRDSEEFFQKLREDVLNYVNKGAEAVAGAIRDIVKQIANGVMAMAIVFNPQFMGQQSAVVFPTSTTEIVQAKVPTSVDSRMSAAAKKAYATLLPTLQKEMKEQNKYFTIVDKPTSTVFVFNPDGTLMDARVVVLGKAMGDFYVGKTDFAKNRITPAGLFKTAAEKGSATYDGKTVYTVGNVAEGWNVVFMHPVYLKESDAQARKDALATGKNTRLSHGCINGPLDFMAKIDNSKMDGSHIFIVPDNQAAVDDFIANKVSNEDLTRVTITPATKNVPGKMFTAGPSQTVVGKEEKVTVESKSKTFANRAIKLFPGVIRKLTQAQFDVLNNLKYETVRVDSEKNESIEVAFISLPDLLKFPAIQQALASLKDVPRALQSVDKLAIFKNEGSLEGADGIQSSYLDADGNVRTILALNESAFLSREDADITHTFLHELGHTTDLPGYAGGVYSSQPEFSKGGAVRRELANLWTNDSNFEFLSYPFADFTAGKSNDATFRGELFAQVWAAFLNPQFKAVLKAKAPQTYAFMEDVVNDIKTTAFSTGTPEAVTSEVKRKAELFADYRGQGLEGTKGSKVKGVNRTFYSKNGQSPVVEKIRQGTQARIDKMPPAYRNTAQKLYDFLTGRNLTDRAIAFAGFTQDVVARAVGYGLGSAATYKRLDDARKQVLASWSVRVEDTLKDFNKLSQRLQGTGPGTVNAFLKNSTMEGKWGFQPDWLEEKVVVDPNMEQQFKAFDLDPSAQKIIKDVFKFNYEVNQAMKEVVMDNTSSEFDALIAQAKEQGDTKKAEQFEKQKASELRAYKTLLDINTSKPYAALKRFGDIVVVAKSQDYLDAEKDKDTDRINELQTQEKHYVVRFFESNSEAQSAYRKMQSLGYAYLTKPFDSADASESGVYGGRDLNGLFYRLRNMAQSDKNDKASLGINKLLNDLHLRLLSEQSARQSENRRKNITGADDDMMRSFATQGRASAHFLSSLHNSGKIYDALQAMRKERDKNPDTKDITSIYYNEIMARHGLEMTYTPTPVVDAALTVTSTWMLLTSPGYFLQNATQPWLLSLPYMSARFKNAGSVMIQAYKDISPTIGKTGITESEYSKLPDDVRSAVEELVNRGVINISLSAETGRFRSSIGQTKDIFEKAGNAYAKATDGLRGIAENIESVNRVATAVAAFRLATTEGKMSADKAIDYAQEVVVNTHGDYSAGNAPRFMRSGLGRVATQFKKIQLIQFSLLARMYNEWRNGQSEKVRQVAFKQMMYTLGHTAAVSGMMGLPGFSLVASMFSAMFGDDDEPDNPELFLREVIGDPFVADLLVKGVPAAFGLDLSGKLGMGQMLSVLPYTDVKLTKESYQEAMLALFGGPFAGGLLPKAVNGLQYMAAGDYWKGIEQLLPKGLSDAAKAYRVTTEGVTDKKGDVLLAADDISLLDGMFTALGLPATVLTKEQFKRGVQIEAEKFFAERTSEMKRDYIKAVEREDSAAMAELREEWLSIQEKRKQYGQAKQPLSDLLRARREQAKRQAKTLGGIKYTGNNRGLAERLNKI